MSLKERLPLWYTMKEVGRILRVMIIGGTYNPIHFGHLFLAEEVRTELNFDKAIFVPTLLPVHKKISPVIKPEHRLNMLKLAVDSYPQFIVDTCELERGGKSFSIDTIEYIINNYSLSEKPGFVIGDDLAITFETWREPARIAQETHLIVVHRLFREEVKFNYKHFYVNNMILPLSSSEIRQRVRNGKSIKFLVREEVREYIEKHNLYR
ncbi:MAG: nicotinate (nicotinamide) nucleotide adenylyltransferase [Spirochaetales bacterium]|nr:nicotinate (nicotinamide) nucleotide adenylyltransferase [Spirochaetales bacterium]